MKSPLTFVEGGCALPTARQTSHPIRQHRWISCTARPDWLSAWRDRDSSRCDPPAQSARIGMGRFSGFRHFRGLFCCIGLCAGRQSPLNPATHSFERIVWKRGSDALSVRASSTASSPSAARHTTGPASPCSCRRDLSISISRSPLPRSRAALRHHGSGMAPRRDSRPVVRSGPDPPSATNARKRPHADRPPPSVAVPPGPSGGVMR